MEDKKELKEIMRETKRLYDEQCKKILSYKQILAYIFKECLEEYKDLSLEKIQELLDEMCIRDRLRASYYFMGALLGKFGHVEIKMPGGCYLGPRPIDLHLKGFEALGATVQYTKGCYILDAKELVGKNIFLDISSVGATTVSYTHLDVYKRQMKSWLCRKAIRHCMKRNEIEIKSWKSWQN